MRAMIITCTISANPSSQRKLLTVCYETRSSEVDCLHKACSDTSIPSMFKTIVSDLLLDALQGWKFVGAPPNGKDVLEK